MRKSVLSILVLGGVAIATSQSDAQNQPTTGGIRLQIANRECAAVSPESAGNLNPNPSDLNDGDLDDAETTAIQQGCTLRAIARDPGRTPLSDLQLTLVRAAAPSGQFMPFGNPRSTDAQGDATWRFQPSPNTDYIYEVVSSDPSRPGARSNSVEIQLCTGDDSVGAIEGAPSTDSGQGCERENGDAGVSDDDESVSDFLQEGPRK